MTASEYKKIVQEHCGAPIRVVHLASGDLWGGAEAQIAQLLPALAVERGLDISAILLNHGQLHDTLRAVKVPTMVLDESRLSSMRILQLCLARFRQGAIDVVHTHRMKENTLGGIAAALSGKCVSVRTVHGAPEFRHPPWALHKHAALAADRYIASRVQRHVVAVSAELAGLLRRRWPSANISVIENGLGALPRRPHERTDSARYRVGYFGRLVPVKRVDVFLRCAARLQDAAAGQYEFHVFGDGPLRESLQAQAVQLGLDATCVFHGFEPDVSSRLASMDCVVLTSDHEGLPMIALEALSAGIPVVAHAVGGLVSLLQGIPGCGLVNSQNPDDFVAQIARVCRRGNRDQIMLPMHYSIERSAADHLRLYRQLLRDGKE